MLIFLIGIGIIGILLLYKAFQSFIKFAIHLEGIVADTHVCWHRPEVRVKRAVRPARDGDEPSLKELRVALGRFGLRLDEGEMLPAVACEHARVILLSFCPAVAYQNGFQVDAKLRVTVENRIFGKHCFFSFRNTPGLTRGPLRPTGEVRLAYGPTLDHFPRCLVVQN